MDLSEKETLKKEAEKEEVRQELEKIRIASPNAIGTITGLGEFIVGYDLRDKQKFGIEIIPSLVTNLLLISGVSYLLFINGIQSILQEVRAFVADTEIIYTALFFILLFGGLDAFFIRAAYRLIYSWKKHPKGVLVYEDGVVWLTMDSYTKVLKESMRICFKDVKSITCDKTISKSKSGTYIETEYNLIITDLAGRRMWSQRGIYDNEYDEAGLGDWSFAMLYAVLNQWAKVYVERELAQHGCVSITTNDGKQIVVGNDYIQDETLMIKREDMVYEFDKNVLNINRKSKARGFFSDNDLFFNYVEMENGHVLMYALEHLLDIHR